MILRKSLRSKYCLTILSTVQVELLGIIWRALFPCNTRIEIHPFGLLPTKYLSFKKEIENYVGMQISKCIL